ncbi:PEP-CTERM sorting domain-containing protein [Pirellulales bacterium]|nr:PEP-CTERM sorting domain-containing protein [Pirellulales bacterium]
MHVLGTLSSGCRSLAEFISELTHKNLLLGALGLGVAVGATPASAAFLDDFSSDTSANYTFEDSYGSGGSHDVSGGTLNITTGNGNTAMVTLTAAQNLAVGESLGVDVPPQSNPNGLFLTLGTALGQPGAAGGDGYRWRRDAGPTGGLGIYQAAANTIILTEIDPDKSSPATLWIDRTASDTFEFQIQLEGGITRTSVGTDTYAALDGISNLHIGMQAFDSSSTVYSFDNLRIVDTATIGAISPKLTVDRDSGGMTFLADPNSAVTILGYSISSNGGALDQAGWTPISGNYDASIGGNGSVDDDDAWTVLSAAGDHTNLSEAELDLAGGDGATLSAGETIDLSQLGGAWIQNPTEDLAITVLFSGGNTEQAEVEFVGNSGNPFEVADLDFNGAINEQDWPLFVAGHLQDLSSLTLAQAYGMGDLDSDGDNDVADFRLFKGAFDAANGGGAFEAMLAGVPEPSTLALLGLGGCLLSMRRAGGPERTR